MSIVFVRFKNGETAFGEIQDGDQCDGKTRTTIQMYDAHTGQCDGFLLEYWEEDVFTAMYPPGAMSDATFLERVISQSREQSARMEKEAKEQARLDSLSGRANSRPRILTPR